MNKKEELQQTIVTARYELHEIECQERLVQAKPLIGKCYKYHNCYSCPKDASDWWWLYVRVIGVNELGWPRLQTFQIDKNGDVSLQVNQERCSMSSYIEIEQDEYDSAWAKIEEEFERFKNRLPTAVPTE